MELSMVQAERVKRRRMSLGLSQTALAEQTGIPIPNLNRIEHGRQSIYIQRLADLATALHCTTDYLLGRSDTPEPLTPTDPTSKRLRTRKTAPVD